VKHQPNAVNPIEIEQLIDLARRRVLTETEQARLDALLTADPNAWPGHDEELALTRLLARLPDAPVSSNFTARVMGEIDAVETALERDALRRPGWFSLRSWFGRLVWSTGTVALMFIGVIQYREWQRAEYARGVAAVSEVAAVPSVEALQDFDAIHAFTRLPFAIDAEADDSLLAALE
jgi:hypothetical protein